MAEMNQTAAEYTKENPFVATLVENRNLNKEGSAKDTRHLVVSLAGSGIEYTVGDSLGIFPTNHPDVVSAILARLKTDGREPVVLAEGDEPISFQEALETRLALASPNKKILEGLLDFASDETDKAKIKDLLSRENREALKVYLAEREIPDLLEDYPSVEIPAQKLVALMRKLTPRLYSIASAPTQHPEEIHLTVAVVKYTTNGRERFGVGSTYLSDRCPLNEPTLPVYVAKSHFRLPEHGDQDVIMVGPGTGIAPFRAFLQEREATAAKGRNWLFFGDQHASCDFLYEEDLKAFQERGVLQRLDTAWSRDQDFKIYVQDKIRENGEAIWEWLEGGAAFYICGDASRMAKDVEAALMDIIQTYGGPAGPEAKHYLRRLRQEKRYQKDVY